MASGERSLRAMVEHWLAPDPAKPVRVTQFRNRRGRRERYVRIETFRTERPIAMFFFRHEDGIWRVFPPGRKRPAMCVPD
nr:hypothetical protein [Paraburkholderia sp. Tr-20389]